MPSHMSLNETDRGKLDTYRGESNVNTEQKEI